MSKPNPLKYYCSACNADRNQRCVEADGKPMKTVHRIRQLLAESMAALSKEGTE